MKQKFDKIIHQLANAGIPLAIAQCQNQERNATEMRAAITFLLYDVAKMTQDDIAELLHRSQQSISYLIKIHKNNYQLYPKYRQMYDDFKNAFLYKN